MLGRMSEAVILGIGVEKMDGEAKLHDKEEDEEAKLDAKDEDEVA